MTEQQANRIETYLFRALWIIMWMLLRPGRRMDAEAEILNWRREYYGAGGVPIGTSIRIDT